MKTLLVLRHAKSDWTSDPDDHDRPLKGRGEKEAHRIGKHLLEIGIVPDAIVTSSARRAKDTAFEVAAARGFPSEKIIVEPRLYLAEPPQILAVIHQLSDRFARAMIVGHNPGLEGVIEKLIGYDVEMKTSGLAIIDFDTDSWLKIELNGRGKLVSSTRGKDL